MTGAASLPILRRRRLSAPGRHRDHHRGERLPVTLRVRGPTAGYREVEVRSRVNGILVRRNYQEGRR